MISEHFPLAVWGAILFFAGIAAAVAQLRALRRAPARATLPPWRPEGKFFLIFVAVAIFCALAPGAICVEIARRFFPEFDLRANILHLIPATQTLSLVALLALLKIFRSAFPPQFNAPPEKRAKNWLSFKNPFGVPAFFALGIFVVSLLALLVKIAVLPLPETVRALFEADQQLVIAWRATDSPLVAALCVPAIAVFTPILEEIIFRAGLYRFLAARATPVPAAVASSVVFALMHDSPASYLPLAAFGCLLCFVYEKTGRIAAPVFVHALFNANTLFALSLQS